MIEDVEKGRQELNLSDWQSKIENRQAYGLLAGLCEAPRHLHMPPKKYLVMHPWAKMSSFDIQLLCDWSEVEQKKLQQSRVRAGAAGGGLDQERSLGDR